MPLLDHFHPPLHPQHHWESFHSNWATRLADALNDRWLPAEFLAEEYTHAGTRLEIDVATFQQPPPPAGPLPDGNPTATLSPPTWAPPAAAHTMPAVFPDSFEVRIFATAGGLTLVAAIELVSPANKDRPEERRAFATKCASYLYQGISLIIMDIVTNRRANLHNDTMRLMAAGGAFELPADMNLYAVAYRPVLRQERAEIDLWPAPCAIGAPLPLLPLRLTGDLFVPVDFEAAYQEACRRRRLA
ncbi:MAG TPA: DUF4058 family protein [Gemmataceae bacterium]|nr:DUF4058 family protein [Gemmataceae bacterium]